MAREIIDTSLDRGSVEISLTFVGSLSITAKKDGQKVSYDGKDLESLETIDEEAYRSGGKAALGAIVGGVLTGGIGLLVGAAFGGRKRQNATYLISFKDGEHIAFSEDRKKVVKYLHDAQIKIKIQSMKK